MFGKSKEIIRLGNSAPRVNIMIINNALVTVIYSGARDTYLPYSIVFYVLGVKHEFTGARLLKSVCKQWNKDEHDIFFTAILVVENLDFIDNEWRGHIVEVR